MTSLIDDKKFVGTEILIVEDSRTQAIGLKFLLKEHGFDVRVAYDGMQALKAVAEKEPALIVSDIVMPEMDGYELCRNLRGNPETKHIPIILLTALSELNDVIKALENGADNFVTKPYKPDFLISRIRHILINSELRRDRRSEKVIEIFFNNQRYSFSALPDQVIDLLLSTFENAVQKNKELQEVNQKLLETQRELREKNKELEKVNAQKDRFLGMAAHDLRNPLGHIFTVADILLEDLDGKITDQQRELLEITKSSSQFMLDLVNDLLDIAKIESGKLNLNLQETDLAALVSQNVTRNRALAGKKNITLEVDVPDDLPPLTVDPGKMEQVLNNLISNAIKYSYPDTTVKIQLARQDDAVLLSVADEGQGIPADEQDKLFQPFERTSVTTTGGEKSTGLGLAIVKRIVEGHHGKIWVESSVGKGTTFYVSLPLVQPEESSV